MLEFHAENWLQKILKGPGEHKGGDLPDIRMPAPNLPTQHWPARGFATVLMGLLGVLIGNQEPTPCGCSCDQSPRQGTGGNRGSFLLPAFSLYQYLSQADPQQKQLAEGGCWKYSPAPASTAKPQARNTQDSAEGRQRTAGPSTRTPYHLVLGPLPWLPGEHAPVNLSPAGGDVNVNPNQMERTEYEPHLHRCRLALGPRGQGGLTLQFANCGIQG
uniref:uncharacterized protein LOC118145065 n=1 Tax=Callithrix jacchus TaxID=9483 RepID=UPI00159DF894|nr:uncharacterized protein LOC118145065 [Callithrix jacchus]